MAALHFPQDRLGHHSQAHRLHYLVTRGRWNEPDRFGLSTGVVMTCIGLGMLGGFGGTLLADAAAAGALLIFLGSPFLVFGGMLLLLSLLESAWRRLRRIQNHCGRCRFYQALEGQYALGRCRADPHEAEVRRTDSCPFFQYSERAMVLDRFAQHAEVMGRSRKHGNKLRTEKKRGMIHHAR